MITSTMVCSQFRVFQEEYVLGIAEVSRAVLQFKKRGLSVEAG